MAGPINGWRMNKIALLPAWMIPLIQKPKDEKPTEPARPFNPVEYADGGTKYGLKALENIVEKMAAAPKGERNVTLFQSAVRLGALVAGGELRDHVVGAVKHAAAQTGLKEDEINASFKSGYEYGLKHPAKAPETAPRGRQGKGNGKAYTNNQASGETPPVTAKARNNENGQDGNNETASGHFDEDNGVVYWANPGAPRLSRQAMRYCSRKAVKGFDIKIFIRGYELVRIVKMREIKEQKGIYFDPNAYAIMPATKGWLADYLTRNLKFYSFRKYRQEQWVAIAAPELCISTVLSIIDELDVPPLKMIITCPTARRDFSIVHSQGYDKETGLFINSDLNVDKKVFGDLRLEDAQKALQLIAEFLAEFPFQDVPQAERYPGEIGNRNFAVALAAIMTGIIRHLFSGAPLFCFSAPTRSTGKSYLATLIALIITGLHPTLLSWAGNEEENRKRIFSLNRRGVQVLCIDNITGELASEALNINLTEPFVTERILGVSESQTVPTCATWLATGNNLKLKSDLTSRAAYSILDAGVEFPDRRAFKRKNLLAEVLENREVLVNAALIILRAHYLADDKPALPFADRFPDWSAVVRSACVWVGAGDPLGNAGLIDRNDSDKEALCELLLIWYTAFGEEGRTTKEALKQSSELNEFFQGVFGKKEGFAVSAGKWLKNRCGRPANGVKLIQLSIHSGGVAHFAVEKVKQEALA